MRVDVRNDASNKNDRAQGKDLLAEELARLRPELERKLRERGHSREDIEDLLQDAVFKALQSQEELRVPQAWLRTVVIRGSRLL